MKYLNKLVIVIGMLAISLSASAGGSSEIKKLRKYARNGSSDAATILGIKYLKGEGVEQDVEKAFRYIKKATKYDNPNPVAFFQMGVFYLNGVNVEQDKNTALDYFAKAAEHKYIPAQRNYAILNQCYEESVNCDKKYTDKLTREVLLGDLSAAGVKTNSGDSPERVDDLLKLLVNSVYNTDGATGSRVSKNQCNGGFCKTVERLCLGSCPTTSKMIEDAYQ